MFNAVLIRIGMRVFDERGMLAVEHGLIVGLIAVVIIGAIGSVGGILFEWAGGTADGPGVP